MGLEQLKVTCNRERTAYAERAEARQKEITGLTEVVSLLDVGNVYGGAEAVSTAGSPFSLILSHESVRRNKSSKVQNTTTRNKFGKINLNLKKKRSFLQHQSSISLSLLKQDPTTTAPQTVTRANESLARVREMINQLVIGLEKEAADDKSWHVYSN